MQTCRAICHDSGCNNFAWPSSDPLNHKCYLSLLTFHLAYKKLRLFKWDLFFSCLRSMQVSMCLLGVRYIVLTLCSIPNAGRNAGLLWGSLLLVVAVCVCLWTKQKQNLTTGVMAKLGSFKKLFDHRKLHVSKEVADKLWFVASDVAYTIYSVVTDAITYTKCFNQGSQSMQICFCVFCCFRLCSCTLL